MAPLPVRIESVATPEAAITAFVEAFPLTSSDVIYDLGCGDGRVLERAVKAYGCVGVGIEIDENVADAARARMYEAGLSREQVRIITGDARDFEFIGATIVYCFQTSELLAELAEFVPPDVLLVSCSHPIPRQQQQRVNAGGFRFYVRQK